MSFQDYQQGPQWQPPPPSSGSATAALVLGILGLVLCTPICSPLALVYGFRARREIDASGGRIGGRGMAVAGIVMGWIGVALLALAILVVVAVLVIGFAASDASTF
ncbi:MAG TPA: DUF4190 domain-containing protein [Solirubrobacter sp.]|nr:DUF4190 domain-containing protein [Solirubrobacter sp.]